MLQCTSIVASPLPTSSSPFTASEPAVQDNHLTKRQSRANQHHRRTRSMSYMDPTLIAQLQADRKANVTRVDSPRNGDSDKLNAPVFLSLRDRLARLNEETKSLTDEEQDEILRERQSRKRVSFDLSRNVILPIPVYTRTPLPPPPPPHSLPSVGTIREPLRIRTLNPIQLHSGKMFNNYKSSEQSFIPLEPVVDDFEDSETETDEWTEEETEDPEETDQNPIVFSMPTTILVTVPAVQRKNSVNLARYGNSNFCVDTLRIVECICQT